MLIFRKILAKKIYRFGIAASEAALNLTVLWVLTAGRHQAPKANEALDARAPVSTRQSVFRQPAAAYEAQSDRLGRINF